MKNIHAV